MAQTVPSPTLSWAFTRLGRFLAPYGVRSVKDECLAKLILVGEPAPRTALRSYVEHFHGERKH